MSHDTDTKARDSNFEDQVITDVVDDGDSWQVNCDGACLVVSKPKGKNISPRPGMVMRTYGGFGFPVRGVDIDGEEVFYRTPSEQGALHAEQVKKFKEERMRKFLESEKAELDDAFSSLPEPFQKRIEKFRRNNPNFRWDFEAYEMFCCKQAVAIATALKTPEAIVEFFYKPYEEQFALVPGLREGHSGNTMGFSVVLAKCFLEAPDNLQEIHGAMAILVGCKEYGCHTGA